LVGFLIKDINDGILRLGSGTSRGLGRIKMEIEKFQIFYYRPTSKIVDVGNLATNEEIADYGFWLSADPPQINIEKNNSYRMVLNLNHEEREQIFEWGAKNLIDFLKKSDWQKNIQNLGA